ncbi:MAG: hypothetical protein JWQ36_2945 [Enterovirga sp.]|jgi:hypothetical protein|nr:hypothetical protein [Enterovirga sp.]
MTKLVAVLALAVLSTPALAQPRPSTTQMSCAQAQSYLAQQGAAVIGTGGMTYDRFVVSRQFCQPTETTREAFVPAADTRACMIGFTCIQPTVEFNGRD